MVSTLSDVFRRRMQEERRRQGVSRDELAARLRAHGHQIDPLTVARIENGRMKRLPLDEAAAIAYALNVSLPLLLEPTQDPAEEVAVIEDGVTSRYPLRRWLRGAEPLPGQDEATFYFSLPADELRDLMRLAREVQGGRPAPRGALVLRRLLVDAGIVDPIKDAPEIREASAEVDEMADAEVREYIEAERERPASDEPIEQLRGELILRLAAAGRKRDEQRGRPKHPTTKEEQQ